MSIRPKAHLALGFVVDLNIIESMKDEEDGAYRFTDGEEPPFLHGDVEDDDVLVVREVTAEWTFEELNVSKLCITKKDFLTADTYARKLELPSTPVLKWYIVATLE